MAFKENLLKKIRIEALCSKVADSIGAPDSGKKIERQVMRELLAMTDFTAQKERDLELYVRPGIAGKQDILVLDNELALYRTTVDDVVLRKSPTLREMISVRNAFKILNDKDVVVAKRSDTVRKIGEELIDSLDLSYTLDDVTAIINDGAASLQKEYGDGVAECLLVLAEILGYKKSPKALSQKHYAIWGALERKGTGGVFFGPVITYSYIHNTLRWIDGKIDLSNKEQILEFQAEISSKVPSAKMGESVLLHLNSLIKPGVLK
jgi:hypothetical protein